MTRLKPVLRGSLHFVLLTREVAVIAGPGEMLGEVTFAGIEIVSESPVAKTHDAVCMCETSGEQCGTRRAAPGRRTVAVLETHPVTGKRIDVWRANAADTAAAKMLPEIVADHNQYVQVVLTTAALCPTVTWDR